MEPSINNLRSFNSKIVRTLSLFSVLLISIILLFLSDLHHQKIHRSELMQKMASQKQTYIKHFKGQRLHFEENKGQFPDEVLYVSRSIGNDIYFKTNEVLLISKQNPESQKSKIEGNQNSNVSEGIRMKFVAANPNPNVTVLGNLTSKSNYFIGDDPKNWHTNVCNYTRIHYEEVYTGIDLVFYGNQGKLEYDFIVKPGADPNIIELAFFGQETLAIEETGNLKLATEDKRLIFKAPQLYQEIKNKRLPIPGSFELTENQTIGFQVNNYDNTYPLVIDPQLIYSTYLGGDSGEFSKSIVTDTDGNIIVAGRSISTQFPQGGTPGNSGGYIFITKLNASGYSHIFTVTLGGSKNDFVESIALDNLGNICLTGWTESEDFPTKNAYQNIISGNPQADPSRDAFVAKLSANGDQFVFSTFFGAGDEDDAYDIAVDLNNYIYIVGETDFSAGGWDFPTTEGAFQEMHSQGSGNSTYLNDIFVAKFQPEGLLVYSTLLGRGYWSDDRGRGIAVDGFGNAYITGWLEGESNPEFWITPGAFQTEVSKLGGYATGFVTKLNPQGSTLVYSTYLAGSKYEFCQDIALDEDNNAFITGYTTSDDFPTKLPFQPNYKGINDEWFRGGDDAFIVKLNADGSDLIFGSLLGGSKIEYGYGIAVDDSANAYITGNTESEDFFTLDAWQDSLAGPRDAFFAKIKYTGELVYSSYLGGSAYENGNGLWVDPFYQLYITGSTNSEDFFTANAFQDTLEGSLNETGGKWADVFITKIVMGEMDMIPDGVAYDPINWDKDVGALQSSFSELKITGTDLENVNEIIFEKNGEKDVDIFAENINSKTNEVSYDLNVVHGAAPGERDIKLKTSDGKEIDVTGLSGRKFIITRIRTFFNQAVNQRDLPTEKFQHVLIANKKGAYRILFDDDLQLGETFIKGELHVTGAATSDMNPYRPYTHRDDFTETDFLLGKDYLNIPFPEAIKKGLRTFRCELWSEKNRHYLCSDIEREFVESGELDIIGVGLRLQKKDGSFVEPPDADEVKSALEFVQKVYPVSDHLFSFKYGGELPIPNSNDVLAESKLEDGTTVTHFTDKGGKGVYQTMVESLFEINIMTKSAHNMLLAFVPTYALAEDTSKNGTIDFTPLGWVYNGNPVALVSLGIDDEGNKDYMQSTTAHEVGHIIETCVSRKYTFKTRLNNDLGDEYEGGQFNCFTNPPVYGIKDRNGNLCENSTLINGTHGDNFGTFVPRSGYDPWTTFPTFHYQGEIISHDSYNFMAASFRKDNVWVSTNTYDALMAVLAPNITPQGENINLTNITPNTIIEMFGTISINDQATFTDVYLDVAGSETPPSEGHYSIELVDGNGIILVIHSFDVQFIRFSDPPRLEPEVFFDIRLQLVEGAKQVVLKKEGITLATQILSDNPPTIEIIYPQDSQSIKGEVDIRWSAADVDGDSLNYSVYYENLEAHKILIASNLTDTHYRFNTTLLPQSTPVSILVIASDGYHKVWDTVDGVRVSVFEPNEKNIMLDGFHLGQNYPNPFNSKTTLWFEVKEKMQVQLRIYDTFGRELKTVINESFEAGQHEIIFDATEFVSGLYFYKINMGGFEDTKKMLLLK
jgi:hypothetical protein